MKEYSEELRKQQHKVAKPLKVDIGDLVIAKIHVPVADSNKLHQSYRPYKIIGRGSGTRLKIQDLETYEVSIRHAEELKKTIMSQTTNTETQANHRQINLERMKIL